MVLFRKGQPAAAQQLFTEVEASMSPRPGALRFRLAEDIDYEALIVWVAFKEASALLNAPST
jgi:hypothetical protein